SETKSHTLNEAMSHQDSKGEKMQAFEGIRQAFVVAGQATETSHPAKAAFDNPASRQQHKSLFGFGQFDHLQSYALFFSGLGRLLASIALVDKGDFDRFARRCLNRLCQLSDLS